MKQPTKKQLRENIAELKTAIYEIWKQLPKGELKDSIKDKYGNPLGWDIRYLNERYAAKFNNRFDYLETWATVLQSLPNPAEGVYYYEAPMPIYPLQEDTDKLKTEA
jgi:hypothetical protein